MSTPKKPPNQNNQESGATAAAAHSTNSAGQTPIAVVLSQDIKRSQRDFAEALHQTKPLVTPGTPEALRAADAVRKGTARSSGLRLETALDQVTRPRPLASLTSGANPKGKLAEVVAISDIRELHWERGTGMVNPPQQLSDNVIDIRLAPDDSSIRDLMLVVQGPDGELHFRPMGQVKNGTPQYTARSLRKMARSRGKGKVGYVPADQVDPVTGGPRIGDGAYTEAEARGMLQDGVRLRGHDKMVERADALGQSLDAYREDGKQPAERAHEAALNAKVRGRYTPKATLGRALGGAAAGAAAGAAITVAIQVATTGEVDAAETGRAASTAAAYGGGGVLAESGLYHLAMRAGADPQGAMTFAQRGVAGGFTLLAIGIDAFDEHRQYKAGEITRNQALAGALTKGALDLLPLACAPLGLAGIPVVVVTQVVGRWLVQHTREAERQIRQAFDENESAVEVLGARMDDLEEVAAQTLVDCLETDAIFEHIMGFSKPSTAQEYVCHF